MCGDLENLLSEKVYWTSLATANKETENEQYTLFAQFARGKHFPKPFICATAFIVARNDAILLSTVKHTRLVKTHKSIFLRVTFTVSEIVHMVNVQRWMLTIDEA
jgi:hypothetical protein